MSTDTIEVDIEDIVEPGVDTSTLDAIISITNSREYFDLGELEGFLTQLNEKGIKEHQITGPLVDWCRVRTYISGDKLTNGFLDLRNVVAPYPVLVEPEANEVEAVTPTEEEING